MTTNYSIDAELIQNALSVWRVVSDSTNTVRFHVADSRSSYRVTKTVYGHYLTLEVKKCRSGEGINIDGVWFENEAIQKAYLESEAAIEAENKLLDKIFGTN